MGPFQDFLQESRHGGDDIGVPDAHAVPNLLPCFHKMRVEGVRDVIVIICLHGVELQVED